MKGLIIFIKSQKQLINMQCSISHLTNNITEPEKIRQLNLTSSSNMKISTITNLEHFTRLRTLILSNNMIKVMEGFDQLVHLRVLNLEFNLVKVVQGTAALVQLEELYLGYNQIQIISQDILNNKKLRILQLAYNDIRNIDQISILYSQSQDQPSLPALTNMSLLGNPLISTLNYVSFFKMLIPTLRYMDDKPVNDDLSTSVYPHQEVIILREAINKLLQERNQAIDKLQQYVEQDGRQRKESKTEREDGRKEDLQIKNKQRKLRLDTKNIGQINIFNSEIRKYLEQSKQKYKRSVEIQREKIERLSKQYTQILNKQKSFRNQQISEQHKYESFESNEHNRSNEGHDNNQNQDYGSEYEQNSGRKSKKIIKILKLEDLKLQDQHNKIRNINRILATMAERQKVDGNFDACRMVLEMVLFGFSIDKSLDVISCQKLCKKYLIKPYLLNRDNENDCISGLIQYTQILKKIILGDNERSQRIDYSQILKLKQKIRGKGLIQIIAELKQNNVEQQRKQRKFQKQKKEFIEQFERQSQKLSKGWQELQKEKQKVYKQRKHTEIQLEQRMQKKEASMKNKYKITEQEQRSKIIQLKRSREKQESELAKLRIEYNEIEQKLNRRFIELEEFENHFNQFIQQKQYIKSLEQEINEITDSLRKEQSRHDMLVDRVRELVLQEGILSSRISKYEQIIKVKVKQLSDIDKNKQQKQQLLQRYRNQVQNQAQRLHNITQNISSKTDELRDLQKMMERTKKNQSLQQQKVNNLQHLQKSKKTNLSELQRNINNIKEDREVLLKQTSEIERNIELKREELIKIQLKIQQNRLAMESLTDINKNIGDMMIRQSQLKRSIIQLEIQNRGLMDIRNGIVDQFRVKTYL